MIEKMVENYKLVFKKYAEFEGRAGRAEYWYFFLANFLISSVLSILDSETSSIFGILGSIYSLVLFIPSLAVGIRRLHDIGKSGWWVLINLIPIAGWIWCIVLLARESQPSDNQYGPYVKPSGQPTTPTAPPSAPTPAL